MESKVAVITGAGRGIGRAIAEELSHMGYDLLLAARSMEQLEEVRAVTSGLNRVHVQRCDVAKSSDVGTLFDYAAKQFGQVDLLVNNAGMGHVVEVAATTNEMWDETLGVNLTGTFLCCREALPLLRKSAAPLIINIGSVAATRAFPNFAAYSAAKAGVVAFSNSLREELRSVGIRVTVMLPGATDSPFWDNVSGDWDRNRMISARDVAKLIASVAAQPPSVTTEQILLMPAGGAL